VGAVRGRRQGRLVLAGAAAALALLVAVYPRPPLPFVLPAPAPEGTAARAGFALFALGDTGARRAFPSLRAGQLAVARGLVSEDLRQPADALLLLGDNFYPDGLVEGELVERIRENLVRPYCRFVDLSAARSGEVAGACGLEPGLRRPLPLHAVLGNHDHDSPESPELERAAIPRYVANWRLAQGLVELRELEPGLSLVLVDSSSLEGEEQRAPLRDALRRAAGPWRILASHHPLAAGGRAEGEARAALMRRAVAEAGVAVQLVLSGHRHNLQAIELEAPPGGLQVIAGGGARIQPLEDDYRGLRFALARTGFARVERQSPAGGEVLVVTLYATPRYPVVFWRAAEPVARFAVDRLGGVRREALRR